MEQKPYQGWSIIVDCDGCLTDGKKYVDATGQRQMIAFHSRDNIACKMLVEMGFRVIIITASSFKGIWEYWKKYGVEVHSTRGSKLAELEKYGSIEDWEKTIGIGDDVTDICYLEKCRYAFIPKDAHGKVEKALSKHENAFITEINGGNGLLAAITSDIEDGILNQ